jgi:hypothetical protein
MRIRGVGGEFMRLNWVWGEYMKACRIKLKHPPSPLQRGIFMEEYISAGIPLNPDQD